MTYDQDFDAPSREEIELHNAVETVRYRAACDASDWAQRDTEDPVRRVFGLAHGLGYLTVATLIPATVMAFSATPALTVPVVALGSAVLCCVDSILRNNDAGIEERAISLDFARQMATQPEGADKSAIRGAYCGLKNALTRNPVTFALSAAVAVGGFFGGIVVGGLYGSGKYVASACKAIKQSPRNKKLDDMKVSNFSDDSADAGMAFMRAVTSWVPFTRREKGVAAAATRCARYRLSHLVPTK